MSKFKKKEALYIGDTMYDFKSANLAKIKYIHANWGYQKIKDKKIEKINKLSELKVYLNYEN